MKAKINPAWKALENKPHLAVGPGPDAYKPINVGPPPTTDKAHSKFLCPSCNKPLRSGIEIKPGGFSEHVVWCGFGPCQPSKLGDGATGKTGEEAYQKLVKMFEE